VSFGGLCVKPSLSGRLSPGAGAEGSRRDGGGAEDSSSTFPQAARSSKRTSRMGIPISRETSTAPFDFNGAAFLRFGRGLIYVDTENGEVFAIEAPY